MLPVSIDTVRLFLHVLAATIWVGGQFTLAGMVPGLRAIDPALPGTMARRFNRIAWPAYGVLIVTGVWNLVALDMPTSNTTWWATLSVKVVVVILSGVSAGAHIVSKSKVGLAIFGALGGVTALGALWLGIQLHG